MADYKTPQWLLPNEKNLAYPAAGAETGSGLSEDRHSLYSMEFDGTDDFIQVGQTTDVIIDFSKPWSVSWWAKWTYSPSFDCFWQFGSTSSPIRYVLAWAHSTGIGYTIGNSASLGISYNIANGLNDGNWHNIVFTGNGNTSGAGIMNVYVDGVLNTDTPTGTGVGSSTVAMNNIGRGHQTTGRNFNGSMDELAIWNKELNQSEIDALFVADAPANLMALPAKPIAYYPLGEQAQMGSANWSFPNGSLQSHVIDFDGSTDFIDVSTVSLGNIFTLSCWVNFNSFSSTQGIIFGGGPSSYALYVPNSTTVWAYFGSGSSFAVPALSGWNNLIFTRNGATGELFLNGQSQGTNTNYGTNNFDLQFIGCENQSGGANQFYVDGELSNVAIWNSDQSTNKANIYNNGSPQSTYTATPTAWWKLNAANSSYVYPWTMSITGNPDYTSSDDGCYISSGVLKWRDTGTAAFTDTFDWYSKEITGANTNITISSTGGEWQGESSSIGLRLFYKIDGGSWVQFQEETHMGGYSPTAWTLTAPAAQSSSSSFQLKVVGFGGAAPNSYVTLNDITVTADAGTLYTESFTDTDGTGFANGVYTPPPVDWTFVDSSGSNNGESDTLPTSALIPSDLQFESPYSNYSLDFDGIGNYLNTQSTPLQLGLPATTITDSDFSLSFWYYYDANENYDPIIQATSGWTTGFAVFQSTTNTSSLNFWVGNYSSGALYTTQLTSGTWYHIGCVFKGGATHTQEIYVNGVLNNTVSYTTSRVIQNGQSCLIAGNTVHNRYFNGKLDEVAIWSSALSQDQIIQVYNNGYPANIASLSPTAWWRLREMLTLLEMI